jgi:DNA repair protein RadC
LAILLGSGKQGTDAVGLAREMLTEFGGLSGLLYATRKDLSRIKGVGKAKIARILASMEIVKRRLHLPFSQCNLIESPEELHDYLKASMGPLDRMEFRLLYLNRSGRLISEDVLFKGAVAMTEVDPQGVAEAALRKKAFALILAHNHPTDLPLAGDEDIQLTRALVRACWNAEIPILDHVVIGRNSFLSMKRHHPEIFEGENDIA